MKGARRLVGWSDTKSTLKVALLGRADHNRHAPSKLRRIYDLTEGALPGAIVDTPMPSEPDAHRHLLGVAARSFSIATMLFNAVLTGWLIGQRKV